MMPIAFGRALGATASKAERPFGRVPSVALVRTLALALALLTCGPRAAGASIVAPAPVVFVPLDDRPVTYQLPRMLGALAGIAVLTPPRASIGRYLEPGDPDAILRWLHSPATAEAGAFVVSSDMLAYGGLVAARAPRTAQSDAFARLRRLADLRTERPGAPIDVFGTIMRLAPTGVPDLGPARGYFATGATVDALAAYANLPDPPQTLEQREKAKRLREQIGAGTLEAYLATRARDREVDLFALQLAAEGSFERVVLGQDDAGRQGLHLRDLAALGSALHAWRLQDRVSIEPGADELGMVLVARAFARTAEWQPSVRVVYSRSDAAQVNDRLEYAPIDVTISGLIAACGARRVDSGADLELFVRVAQNDAGAEAAFVDGIAAAVEKGRPVAVADLTFLSGPSPSDEQQALVKALLERGVAARLDAFASWNTAANTVGTALAAAIAAGSGRRLGTYDRRAHAQFMLNRYIDDYAFHQFVRPGLNAELRAAGKDTSLLLPEIARRTSSQNRAQLWPLALDLAKQLYPEYRDGGLAIALPWDRTFETELDVRLAGS
jgi:hypothetical protein